MQKTGLVDRPFPRQEYESVEPHSISNYRNALQRLFQDDVDVAVHGRRIRYPPEIEPVSVDLVYVSSLSLFGRSYGPGGWK